MLTVNCAYYLCNCSYCLTPDMNTDGSHATSHLPVSFGVLQCKNACKNKDIIWLWKLMTLSFYACCCFFLHSLEICPQTPFHSSLFVNTPTDSFLFLFFERFKLVRCKIKFLPADLVPSYS